jgi:hypothetical protein
MDGVGIRTYTKQGKLIKKKQLKKKVKKGLGPRKIIQHPPLIDFNVPQNEVIEIPKRRGRPPKAKEEPPPPPLSKAKSLKEENEEYASLLGDKWKGALKHFTEEASDKEQKTILGKIGTANRKKGEGKVGGDYSAFSPAELKAAKTREERERLYLKTLAERERWAEQERIKKIGKLKPHDIIETPLSNLLENREQFKPQLISLAQAKRLGIKPPTGPKPKKPPLPSSNPVPAPSEKTLHKRGPLKVVLPEEGGVPLEEAKSPGRRPVSPKPKPALPPRNKTPTKVQKEQLAKIEEAENMLANAEALATKLQAIQRGRKPKAQLAELKKEKRQTRAKQFHLTKGATAMLDEQEKRINEAFDKLQSKYDKLKGTEEKARAVLEAKILRDAQDKLAAYRYAENLAAAENIPIPDYLLRSETRDPSEKTGEFHNEMLKKYAEMTEDQLNEQFRSQSKDPSIPPGTLIGPEKDKRPPPPKKVGQRGASENRPTPRPLQERSTSTGKQRPPPSVRKAPALSNEERSTSTGKQRPPPSVRKTPSPSNEELLNKLRGESQTKADTPVRVRPPSVARTRTPNVARPEEPSKQVVRDILIDIFADLEDIIDKSETDKQKREAEKALELAQEIDQKLSSSKKLRVETARKQIARILYRNGKQVIADKLLEALKPQSLKEQETQETEKAIAERVALQAIEAAAERKRVITQKAYEYKAKLKQSKEQQEALKKDTEQSFAKIQEELKLMTQMVKDFKTETQEEALADYDAAAAFVEEENRKRKRDDPLIDRLSPAQKKTIVASMDEVRAYEDKIRADWKSILSVADDPERIATLKAEQDFKRTQKEYEASFAPPKNWRQAPQRRKSVVIPSEKSKAPPARAKSYNFKLPPNTQPVKPLTPRAEKIQKGEKAETPAEAPTKAPPTRRKSRREKYFEKQQALEAEVEGEYKAPTAAEVEEGAVPESPTPLPARPRARAPTPKGSRPASVGKTRAEQRAETPKRSETPSYSAPSPEEVFAGEVPESPTPLPVRPVRKAPTPTKGRPASVQKTRAEQRAEQEEKEPSKDYKTKLKRLNEAHADALKQGDTLKARAIKADMSSLRGLNPEEKANYHELYLSAEQLEKRAEEEADSDSGSSMTVSDSEEEEETRDSATPLRAAYQRGQQPRAATPSIIRQPVVPLLGTYVYKGGQNAMLLKNVAAEEEAKELENVDLSAELPISLEERLQQQYGDISLKKLRGMRRDGVFERMDTKEAKTFLKYASEYFDDLFDLKEATDLIIGRERPKEERVALRDASPLAARIATPLRERAASQEAEQVRAEQAIAIAKRKAELEEEARLEGSQFAYPTKSAGQVKAEALLYKDKVDKQSAQLAAAEEDIAEDLSPSSPKSGKDYPIQGYNSLVELLGIDIQFLIDHPGIKEEIRGVATQFVEAKNKAKSQHKFWDKNVDSMIRSDIAELKSQIDAEKQSAPARKPPARKPPARPITTFESGADFFKQAAEELAGSEEEGSEEEGPVGFGLHNDLAKLIKTHPRRFSKNALKAAHHFHKVLNKHIVGGSICPHTLCPVGRSVNMGDLSDGDVESEDGGGSDQEEKKSHDRYIMPSSPILRRGFRHPAMESPGMSDHLHPNAAANIHAFGGGLVRRSRSRSPSPDDMGMSGCGKSLKEKMEKVYHKAVPKSLRPAVEDLGSEAVKYAVNSKKVKNVRRDVRDDYNKSVPQSLKEPIKDLAVASGKYAKRKVGYGLKMETKPAVMPPSYHKPSGCGLKKGSEEARKFMAELRARKGKKMKGGRIPAPPSRSPITDPSLL